ncbi:MAG: BlaI/MecI/CopY family transcriptional regulator [ANME-2 cluster archaeon]|nr:BlaI/MecI/CopY family transcriptional regulator [ANME-2 cluster archaeon]
MVKFDRVYITNKGLTKFFSPLESEIMYALWECDALTSQQVTEITAIPQASTSGILDRLVRNGYVLKKSYHSVNNGAKYNYSAAFTYDVIAEDIMFRILDSLYETFGELAEKSILKYKTKPYVSGNDSNVCD